MKAKITIVAKSQYNIVVQPVDAEAYDYPAQIALECHNICEESGLPVILKGKNQDTYTFMPFEVKRKRKIFEKHSVGL